MLISELVRYGFPEAIIQIWEQQESVELLPIQEVAIGNGLLDGQSMLVISPTSSGKTFAAEIAAYKCAQEQKKVLYLAPHKAMVEEKYLDFRRKYQQYGIRVAVSSGDHREYDNDIRQNDFDLAIFTYEKLAMLMVVSPEIASTCGLLVIDEIQMLSDRHRGADLELLLTKFRTLSGDAQIVALSATIDDPNGLDSWLEAQAVTLVERPIELREGVYTPDGRFRFREWNSHRQGTERFPPARADDPDAMLDALVTHLVSGDEQVLIFLKDKLKTREVACRIANAVNVRPVAEAISALRDLEATAARELLIECLRNGVAFHNADLVSEERLLIERHFQEGDIRVICSTSTLAMGVNLPARTVIIADAERWDRDEETGQWASIPISVSEYRNMSGRAGRYRFQDEYGRAVLLAGNDFLYDRYRVSYIGGTVATIESTLGSRRIDQQVLDIIASQLGQTEDEIVGFLMGTFAGFRKWKTPEAQAAISARIREAIQRCLDLELVRETRAGVFTPTDVGRACASKKLSLDTYVLLRDWLSDALPVNSFTAIYLAVHAPELSRVSFNMSAIEHQSDAYTKYIGDNYEELEVPPEILQQIVPYTQGQVGYDETKRLKMAIMAMEWIDGCSTTDLEGTFRVSAGQIRNACAHLAWIIDSAAALAPFLGRSLSEVETLCILIDRLHYGVPEDALPLARLRTPGANRTQIMRLVAHDYASLDRILDADLAGFQGIIPRVLAARLQEYIQESMDDSMDRQKCAQVLRLQKLNVDPSVLLALYEKTGTDLEVSMCDLFAPPFCSLKFERIPTQREAEPDNLLYLTDGHLIAFSVTASETKKISMKKAGEIMSGAARYKPIARVVIGRPDFHELAIRNAQEIVDDGTNLKLLPVPVLAEMYVRVFEGQLGEDDVVRILTSEQGYLTFDSLGGQ